MVKLNFNEKKSLDFALVDEYKSMGIIKIKDNTKYIKIAY